MRQCEYLTIVARETVNLSRLIDDLFALSTAEAGTLPLNLEPVRLGEVVAEVASSIRPVARGERQITVVDSAAVDLPPALADRRRVVRVLCNLTSNAPRHTPEVGLIALRAEQQDGRIVVTVEDTGEGISPERLPHVFERFYRGDAARDRASGGAGLGLAIVRELVEAMGGDVAVESVVGQGARFAFHLPLARNCLKRVTSVQESKLVYYGKKRLLDRSVRRGVDVPRAARSRSQTGRAPAQAFPARTVERHLRRDPRWRRLASAAERPAALEDGVSLLASVAPRRHHGAHPHGLRERLRVKRELNAQSSAAILDSQSVKTTVVGGERGYDRARKLNGRKRHLLVDTRGLVLRAKVHRADLQDRAAVPLVLKDIDKVHPRIEHIWLDQGYYGAGKTWIEEHLRWTVEVVRHPPEVAGCRGTRRRGDRLGRHHPEGLPGRPSEKLGCRTNI